MLCLMYSTTVLINFPAGHYVKRVIKWTFKVFCSSLPL